MKNHRFLWLRNRTTNNRKCEKARNIKEKRTIEMFNTVSRKLVELHSSQRDNYFTIQYVIRRFRKVCYTSEFRFRGVFSYLLLFNASLNF